jgi:hypothetical protein
LDDKCQITLTEENTVLVVKFAPNMILSDPSYINGYKKNVHGFETGLESARNNAAEAQQDRFAGKWYTFRYKLDWPAKPTVNLMGTMPWFAFSRITVYGQKFPVVIINLSSIEPIKIRKPPQVPMKLSKLGLDYDGTPQKAGAASPNAQMGNAMAEMIKKGLSMEDIAKNFGFVLNPDGTLAMDISEDGKAKKRPRAGAPEGPGSGGN